MTDGPWKLGTRGSPLALWQAETVRDQLATSSGATIELITMRTRAENFPEQSLAAIGVGVFTKELDDALLRGEIDLAVHSSKDIPSQIPDGLMLAAFLPREIPLDAFVGAGGLRFDEIPPGARVGTSSPRRQAQLLAQRPDLDVRPLRGNVDTRLRKLDSEGFHGTLLALAGLRRLGRETVVSHVFSAEELVPAVGQGAVAVVTRDADEPLRTALRALDDDDTRVAVEAERAFLAELRGGCQAPAGALAERVDGGLRLRAVLATRDGRRVVRGDEIRPVEDRLDLGRDIARRLLDEGGREILAALRGADS